MDETIKVEITGDASSVVAAMRQMTGSVSKSVGEAKGHLASLTESFEKVKNTLLGLSAIVAGGKLFGEVISSTLEWGEGVRKLSAALGITSEQASVYQGALEHIGSSSDALIGATQLMTRALVSHGNAFKTLGVSIHDAEGNARPILDVFNDALEVLRNIDDPIQRNITGMQLFGRGWGSVREMLLLTNPVMKETEERLKDLGLVYGPEKVEQLKQFKEQLNDLKLVGTALASDTGTFIIPKLAELGTLLDQGLRQWSITLRAFGEAWDEVWSGDFSKAYATLDKADAVIERMEKLRTMPHDPFSGPLQSMLGGGGKGLSDEFGNLDDLSKLTDLMPVDALLKKMPTFNGAIADTIGGAGGDSGVGHKMGKVFDDKNLKEFYDGIDKLDNQSNTQRLDQWKSFFRGVSTGFQSVLTGFLQGTRSLQSLVRGIFDAILASIVNVIVKIGEQWVETHILTRIAARLTAVSNVQGHAAEAGAAGVASMAAAPWPLDMSAPAFGAAMASAAEGFMGVAAAEKGFDVPAGATPLTLLHPREMVLPAGIADQVRSAASGGGGTVVLKTERLSSTHDIVRRSDLVALLKNANARFAFG